MTINISGNIYGYSSISYKLNCFRRSSYNPTLFSDYGPYDVGDCPIAAIEYKGFSPNKIININPRDSEIYENTLDYHKIENIISSSGIYPIKHYPYHSIWNSKLRYLVTDYKTSSSNGIPLFFQYELMFDCYSSNNNIPVYNIYKNNDTIISRDRYIIQYSYDLLSSGNTRYSSSTWGAINNSNNIHRIRVLLPYEFLDQNDFYTIEYEKYINGIKQYQKELIDLVSLYDTSDYTITSSGLVPVSSGNLSSSGTIMLTKDPRYTIRPLDVVSIKDEGYLSSKTASWRLRLNVGSFLRSSGYFSNSSGNIYNLEEKYYENYIPITNTAPTLVRPDILKLKESPIYIDTSTYCYPNYYVGIYDKENDSLTDSVGKIAIDVNGSTRRDIKIKSIDTKKGFINIDTNLSPTDEIEITFYATPDNQIVIDNLELNPRVSGNMADFHISGYQNGFGIAVKPYSNDISGWYPYIYDLSSSESTRTMYSIPPRGTYSSNGVSLSWRDYNFITICEVNLNRLSKDNVKMTDARRPGGGVIYGRQLDTWFSSNYSGVQHHEKEWYLGNAYYGGEPLPNTNLVIIHIPNNKIEDMRSKWLSYYKKEIDDIDTARDLAESEFKHYLDQVIKRHISAGNDYIIIPTVSGVIGNKILDLRQ